MSSWGKVLLIIIAACICLTVYDGLSTKNFRIRPIKNFLNTRQQFSGTIGGFYHFSTIGSRWKGIVTEQMLLAHLSGLINASSNVHVTGLGKIEDNESIFEIYNNTKFVYEYDTRTDLYEYPTLKKLETFCLHNSQSLVWYAHSKGASYKNNNAAHWRDIMNFFVLDKWHHCYVLLSTTNYTTCGAILTLDSNYRNGWNTFYAGNMWWAKCSHINRLTRLEKIDQKSRYNAEMYVTSEPAVGHFNCFYSDLSGSTRLNKKNASCTLNYPLWKIR